MQCGQSLAHDPLVLRVHQRIRPRMDDDALRGQRSNVLTRHVLVVEGDDVAALGEAHERVEVGVVANHCVGRDEGRAVVGRGREHAQRLAQRDRGLMRHPGELAATHHADHGQTRTGIHRRPAYATA